MFFLYFSYSCQDRTWVSRRSCTAESERTARSDEYCGLAVNQFGPFAVCIGRVSAAGYFGSCVNDVCQNRSNILH